jgi:hypothetical protein
MTKYLLILIPILLLILALRRPETFIIDSLKYSVDVNSNQKLATLYNIEQSANIPGINNTDTYHLGNKCVKWAANASCTDSARDPANDLTCENSVTQANGGGYCDCTSKKIHIECNDSRKDFTCNSICANSSPPKALEFNGKDSKVEMNFETEVQGSFTVNLFLRLSGFIRFPYKEQIVLLILDADTDEKLFMLYVNTSRKICYYSFKAEQNYISDTELDTDWHNISFGSKFNQQFIQIDATRKEFSGPMTQNKYKFIFGGYPQKYENDSDNLNYFKGLLGNIKIHKTYLSNEDICKGNRYCDDIQSFNNEDKCMFKPKGHKLISCIQDCKDNTINNGCNIDQCMAKCETCNDPQECKWNKKAMKCGANEPEQPVHTNKDKCEFKAWGIDKDHCVSECSEVFGGDKCTKTKCADICNKCTDQKYCSWLIKNPVNNNAKPPNPPLNLVGVPASRTVLLMWSQPQSNNSPITGYKILYYMADKPKDGVFLRNIREEDITLTLKYNLENLENDVVYNIGVIAINSIGASSLSKLISVKPSDTTFNTVETFTNFNSKRKPNLFNNLKGKTFEIQL